MTLFFVLVTVLVSAWAFQNQSIFEKCKFNASYIYHKKELYRMLSHSLIHADWAHLAFNMIGLYSFGDFVETFFSMHFSDGLGKIYYVLLYLSGIVVASLSTLYKHKDHEWYNSVGASGGVSAVVFAAIFLNPMLGVNLFLIPIDIPGFIFAIAYLAYSHYMSRRGGDNINHDAHLYGAVYGFLFPLILEPRLINMFINSLMGY